MSLRCYLGCALWLSIALSSGAHAASDWQLLREDVQRLCNPASIARGGATLGVTLLARSFDTDVQGPFNNAQVEPLLDMGNRYFDSVYVLPAAVILRIAALRWGSDEGDDASSHLLRALVLANGMVAPLKVAVGRARPDKSNRFSFPSGHSANAFALAAVLGYHGGKYAALTAYAVASFVPMARIHARHHYLSDVVAGAGLGVLAGWISGYPRKLVAFSVSPMPVDGGWGLRVHWLR